MTFDVTILGCGAATPTSRHHPSAQVVNVHDKLYLIDCGEGTQMQLRRYRVRFQRINHLFISHLHGDHYLGLIGLISSLHLLGRRNTLHVYGPPELKELIDLSLRISDTFLMYSLEFHSTTFKEKTLIHEDRTMEVWSFPLKHRIDCCGFLFVEKERPFKIKRSAVEEFKMIPSEILQLKKGLPVQREDGLILHPDELCTPPVPPRSYAYCSDTAISEKVMQAVQNADLLYHESTFLESEKVRAKETFHSTAKQAAEVALQANVKRLLLGHYSSRYTNDADFLHEAREIFEHVSLSNEGLTFHVGAITSDSEES